MTSSKPWEHLHESRSNVVAFVLMPPSLRCVGETFLAKSNWLLTVAFHTEELRSGVTGKTVSAVQYNTASNRFREDGSAVNTNTLTRTVGDTICRYPLELFSKLDYSTAERVATSNMVVVEPSRSELSENVCISLHVYTLFVEKRSIVENLSRACDISCHLRYSRTSTLHYLERNVEYAHLAASR